MLASKVCKHAEQVQVLVQKINLEESVPIVVEVLKLVHLQDDENSQSDSESDSDYYSDFFNTSDD